MWTRFVRILLVGWLSTGCALLSGVDLHHVSSSVQQPSNVAFYVAVTDRGDPVVDLQASNFQIFENEQPVSAEQSGLTLLDRDLAAIHHTLLLVDLGGAASETVRADLAHAAAGFVDKVRPTQGVTVYAFDGGPQVRLIGDFPRSTEGASDLSALAAYVPSDPSRNLYGAVTNALTELDARLSRQQKPVRVGTLVVLARGADLAGRLTREQLAERLDSTQDDVFAIGIGDDPELDLDELGPDGTVRAQSAQTLAIAFEEMATKVVKASQRYYLVAYCSPSRSGIRRARLEVDFTTLEGSKKTASLDRDFDARGFGPGCDSQSPPRFVTGTLEPGAVVEEKPAPKVSAPVAAPISEEPTEEPPPKQAGGKKHPVATPAPEEDGAVAPPEGPGYE